MHILFVDESGTAPEPAHAEKSPKFVLGGIVISEKTWPKLRDELEIVKRKYSVDGEIKWRYFHRSQTLHHETLEHLSARNRDRLRVDLFSILKRYPSAKVIACVVDPVHAYKQNLFQTADDLYHHAFGLITKQFVSYLTELSDRHGLNARGLVVADSRSTRQDSRLRTFHHLEITEGKAKGFEMLVEGLFLVPSDLSVGIQFADLVAGAIFRKHVRYDSEFWDALASSAIKGIDTSLCA